jgi:hypothetical protein
MNDKQFPEFPKFVGKDDNDLSEAETVDPSTIEDSLDVQKFEVHLDKIKELKASITAILDFGDVTTGDRTLIDQIKKNIEVERQAVAKCIEEKFDVILKEIKDGGPIESSSTTHDPKAVIYSILELKDAAFQKQPFDLNTITSARGIRSRVEELARLIVEINSL